MQLSSHTVTVEGCQVGRAQRCTFLGLTHVCLFVVWCHTVLVTGQYSTLERFVLVQHMSAFEPMCDRQGGQVAAEDVVLGWRPRDFAQMVDLKVEHWFRTAHKRLCVVGQPGVCSG